MIPQHAAAQAITLSKQGWTVSAIARHFGHDRKTIRIYLNGRRQPGQPRQQADSFAPFAAYAARRVRDDPHLRASGLHRELAELGYLGSYSALTRELRSSGITTTCPTCHRNRPPPSAARRSDASGRTCRSASHPSQDKPSRPTSSASPRPTIYRSAFCWPNYHPGSPLEASLTTT